jgi:hypothetical protein
MVLLADTAPRSDATPLTRKPAALAGAVLLTCVQRTADMGQPEALGAGPCMSETPIDFPCVSGNDSRPEARRSGYGITALTRRLCRGRHHIDRQTAPHRSDY